MENDTPRKLTRNEVKATQALASMIATIQELRRLEAVTSLVSLCETVEGIIGELSAGVVACEQLLVSRPPTDETLREIKNAFSKPLAGKYLYCGHHFAITDALAVTRKLSELMTAYEEFWRATKTDETLNYDDLRSAVFEIHNYIPERYEP